MHRHSSKRILTLVLLTAAGLLAESAFARASALSISAPADLYAVLVQPRRLVATAPDCVLSYDGLTWTSHAVADTLRWLEEVDGSILAGGTRGLWRAPSSGLDFERIEGSPRNNRCVYADSAGVDTTSGGKDATATLWLGTDAGLFRWDPVAKSATPIRSGARVQCITRHPELGLAVGTWNAGLWLLRPDGRWQDLRAPEAGVTDTLAGNYIHDLVALPDGDLLISASWGGLEPRLTAYANARKRGWITEADPHDFRRASLCRYDGQRWQVEYLFQNYTSADRCQIEHPWSPLLRDLDGDGRQEWLVSYHLGRRLHPRSLHAFDLGLLEPEWSLALASSVAEIEPFQKDGRTWLMVLTADSDQGSLEAGITDSAAHAYLCDDRGRIDSTLAFPPGLQVATAWDSGPGTSRERARIRFTSIPRRGQCISGRSPAWDLSIADFSLSEAESVACSTVRHFGPFKTDHGWVWITSAPTDARLPAMADAISGSCLVTADSASVRDALRSPPIGWKAAVLDDRSPGAWIWSQSRGVIWDGTVKSVVELPTTVRASERMEFFRHLTTAVDYERPLLRVWRWAPPAPPSRFSWVEGYLGLRLDSRLLPLAEFAGQIHERWKELLPEALVAADPRDSNGVWIEATNVDGMLPILDNRGHRVGGLRLPQPMADESDLAWIRGSEPIVDGRRTVALASTGCPPWSIYLLDPRRREWIAQLDLDEPFQDLHCNGVTALDPQGVYAGSESGLRSLALRGGGSDHWARDASQRVRGLQRTADGELLTWGRAGLQIVDTSTRPELLRARDLFESGDDLFALEEAHLLRRRGDQDWIGAGDLPNSADFFTLSCMLAGPAGPWVQMIGQDGVRGIYRWPDLKRPWGSPEFGPFFIQGRTRRIHVIHALPDGRWLAATEWGLLLVSPGHTAGWNHRNLTSDHLPCTDLVQLSNGDFLATLQDGSVWTVPATAPESLVADPRSRSADDAILEMRTDDETIWARGAHRLERWRADDPRDIQHWSLPDSLETLSMDASTIGGTWLGTTRGLWRLSDGESALVPVTREGLRGRPIQRVWEVGPEGHRQLAILSEGDVFVSDLPHELPEARFEADGPKVKTAIWGDGPAPNPGRAVLRKKDGSVRVLQATEEADGVASYSLPTGNRGRHHLRLVPFDAWGRQIGSGYLVEFATRSRQRLMALLAVLLPAPLLAIWAFDSRRGWRFVLLALVVALVIPMGIYELLLFQVPWESSAGVSLAIVLVGILARQRERAREIPAKEALERLILLLSAFRHRGRGISPVDELLLIARNLDELSEGGEDVEAELTRVFRDILDATEDLSREVGPLLRNCGVHSPLLRRFRRRLEELREIGADVTEDRRALLRWCASSDERIATEELCTSFIRSVEATSELLRRHAGTDLPELLEEFRARPRSGVVVDVQVAPGVSHIPVAADELRELLENLESNAVRAAGTGGDAAVRIRIEATLNDSGDLELSVEDDGPGVPSERREAIFQMGVSGTGSTGTGLHRCRTLAHSWEGSLHCEPAEGLPGARFVLRLPLRGDAVR